MNKPNQQTCFDQAVLSDYLNEKLDEPLEARIQEHLCECNDCQQQLENVAASATVWKSIRQNEPLTDDVADHVQDDERLQRIIDRLAPTDDPKMLGRLGSYEICGVIGQGSTGIVLKALEPSLNRYVAIKMMSPVYSSRGAARKRFEREGRAIAAVIHENVVPIYAVDEHQGIPFIVMQYVPGVSLLQRIDKNGSLDTCEVTRIGYQVALGLAAAHKQGIVHRDVKPANVILENTVDRAMVTDFGLARVTDEASMTQSGTIAGTPQYMAPEQAKGDPVDPRSDLFSLGSLLYAACTARPPFRAETLFGMINKVCQAEPRQIREFNPEIEEWLCALIGRLMAKNPDDRFQSAKEVAKVLEAELAYLQSPTTSPKPNRDWMPAKPVIKTKVAQEKPQQRNLIATGLLFGGIALALCALLWGPSLSERLFSNPAAKGEAKDSPNFSKSPVSFFNEKIEDIEVSDEPTIAWRELEGDWDTGATATFDQKWQQAFRVTPGGTLELKSNIGDVVVRPNETKDKVSVTMMRRIEAATQAAAENILADHTMRIIPSEDGMVIRTSADKSLKEHGSPLSRVLFRVSVPKGFAPRIDLAEGNITIGQLESDVNAIARSGKIKVDRVDGNLNVEGSGGCIDVTAGCGGKAEVLALNSDVYISNADEGARVRSSGGSVWLGESKGKVYVQTSGGDITVENTQGLVQAYALDGNVKVLMDKTPAKNSHFGATQGNLKLIMRSDVAAKVRMPVENELEGFETSSDENGRWNERVFNDGEATIHCKSDSGEIEFKVIDVSNGAITSSSKGKSLGGSGLGGSGSGMSRETAENYLAAYKKLAETPGPGKIATIKVDGGDMDGYTLYLPKSHGDSNKEFPILVSLTGAWGVGGPIESVNWWGLVRLIRDEEDMSIERNQLILDSFIVVMPHIKTGQYYNHPETVEEIVNQVAKSYRGDMDRVYLTGLSRGGHGTWGLAAKLPNLFAAIVPIAGNINDVKDFDELAKPAIWIAHNTGDGSFGDSLKAIKQLEKRGDDKFLRIDSPDVSDTDYLKRRYILTAPKRNHHDAWTEMYTRPEVYKWMLEQSKSD